MSIHHVTAIAGDPQRNLDFYAGIERTLPPVRLPHHAAAPDATVWEAL
ncbi:MAG: VOC family protein [Gemmatimonadota bacterium]|nr:VOC family protein [Gemmatimonadota bacterium]